MRVPIVQVGRIMASLPRDLIGGDLAGESLPGWSANGLLPIRSDQFLGFVSVRPTTDFGRGAAGFWSFAAGAAGRAARAGGCVW